MKSMLRVVALAIAAMIVLPVAAQSAHSVSLAWTASTDAGVSYNVYRLTGACPTTGSAGFAKITAAPVAATAYTDTGMAPGAYCYYATSVLNGAESAPSNLAAAVILPAPPTSLATTGTK
jgi:cellulose 1,4-beta-cellobiosidase